MAKLHSIGGKFGKPKAAIVDEHDPGKISWVVLRQPTEKELQHYRFLIQLEFLANVNVVKELVKKSDPDVLRGESPEKAMMVDELLDGLEEFAKGSDRPAKLKMFDALVEGLDGEPLSFEHPETGKDITISTELVKDHPELGLSKWFDIFPDAFKINAMEELFIPTDSQHSMGWAAFLSQFGVSPAEWLSDLHTSLNTTDANSSEQALKAFGDKQKKRLKKQTAA